MEIINILGMILAEKINISPPAARGLIKLSIKDELGPFKPLEQLVLDDFLYSINKALKKRLFVLNIPNADSIVKDLSNYLKENPSLLSITKI